MKKIAPLLIVFAAILWSLDGILRLELQTIPAATIVMIEHIIGLALLLPFLPYTLKKAMKISRRDWGVLVINSIVGGVLGTYFYTLAMIQVNYDIKYTVVILLQQTQPIFAVTLAYMFLNEKLNKQYIVLAICGIIAVYFLSFPFFTPRFMGKTNEIWAALFALGAAASWGSATVISKLILTRNIDFLTITTIRFIIVIPCAYVLGIIFNQNVSSIDIFFQLTPRQWQLLFGIAITAGTVAMCIYYKGLQYTPARTSTILELAYPISAIFIGYFYLEERLTFIQLIAAFVLLTVIFQLVWIQIKQENNTNDKN